jgi:APA family basic amino acid/polyamine antiporter
VAQLLRRLGLVDLSLITVGAVIGSGIFRNPAVVAQRAHLPWAIMAAWIAGGLLALIGAFAFAELAARRPVGGGTYAYLRDAYDPAIAFVFGWTLLLIADTGGTAASASLFSGYFVGYVAPQLHHAVDPRLISVLTLGAITGINCLGVRQGSTWQHVLVVLKVAAIAGLIVGGLFAPYHPAAAPAFAAFAGPPALIGAFGVAMLPVLFAYNGFQAATYLSAETRDPARTLPLGLLIGVSAVVAIYILVNVGCLRVLGAEGLAASKGPAAEVMQAFIGPLGGRLIAVAIAISTLGFMSTKMLMAPRLYFQMAADGTFFKQIAWVSPKTHVPMVAIALQGVFSAAIAASGSFEQIVNWVTAPEWLFTVFAVAAVFIVRHRDRGLPNPGFMVPGHPWTTGFFIAALIGVFLAEVAYYPLDTLYGLAVVASGFVFYYVWRRTARK